MSFAIGIDVGASTIKGVLLSNGQVLMENAGRTFGRTKFEESYGSLTRVIDSLWHPQVMKIGVVTTGDVDVDKGVVTYAVNLPGWTNAPLKSLLEKRYRVPVHIENDAVGGFACRGKPFAKARKNHHVDFWYRLRLRKFHGWSFDKRPALCMGKSKISSRR